MSEMRKCKECGKLFVPKGREQYCSEDHYRPCPVCGKPVLVKYLSDPARKCDDCRYRKTKPLPPELAKKSKSIFNFVPEDMTAGQDLKLEAEIPSETDRDNTSWQDSIDLSIPPTIGQAAFCEQVSDTVRTYCGPKLKTGFIPGHEYILHVTRDDYTYVVSSVEDLTADEPVSITCNYSSQISFYQHFAKKRVKGEHSGVSHNS